jgi:hypothetical protein
MPPVAKRQVDESASLILAFMRKLERDFSGDVLLHQRRKSSQPLRKLVRLTRDARGRLMDHGTV